MAPDRVYPDAGGFPSAPAGAYYNVKDQQIPRPATYRSYKRSRSPCCCLCKWLFSILIILAIVLGIAVLVFWLVVRPKAPKYQVENVQLSGMNINVTTSTLTAETKFEVLANNPNKRIGIYYDKIAVNVQTMGLTIGQGDLPPFYQGHKNITYINGDLISQPITVDQTTQTNLLNARSAGKVPVNLNVDVRARLKIGSWKSRKYTVKVRCNIDLDLSKTQSQVVDSHCKVKF